MRVLPSTGLWLHADFVRLWCAQTISLFGSQISQVAIPLAAILVLDASPFEVAVLGTVEFLPFVLFALPAGVWIDRLRRRPVLIAADVGRALLLATIPLAHVADVLSIWQLYAVGFAVGCCTVFFDIAYHSYLPSLVDRSALVEGNAKLEISRSSAQIAGPGLGGVLVQVATAPYAVLVDAVSFVFSALFLARIRRTEEPVERPVDRSTPGMWVEVREGLAHVLGSPYLRAIATSSSIFNFFGSVAVAIYLVYLVRGLDLSPLSIGIVLATTNVGALVAATTFPRLPNFGPGPTIIGSLALAGVATLLVPAAPRDFPLPFLLVAGVVAGFAGVIYNVTQVSFRQAITPERLQGRMNSVLRFLLWGAIPLGTLSGGALATWIGLRATLVVASIGVSLAFVAVLLSPVRELREMPHAPIEAAPSA